MRLNVSAACMITLLLGGCTAAPDPFAGSPASSRIDPLTFFTGHVRSWGVMENRGGAPTRVVMTECRGTQDSDGVLHLVQHLTFQDGETQERDWVMRRTGPDTMQATANDMVGTADGRVSGPSFHWRWTLAHSPGNPLLNLGMEQWMFGMEQWMYRLPDDSVMIRTTISKLDVTLAEVSERFAKVGD